MGSGLTALVIQSLCQQGVMLKYQAVGYKPCLLTCCLVPRAGKLTNRWLFLQRKVLREHRQNCERKTSDWCVHSTRPKYIHRAWACPGQQCAVQPSIHFSSHKFPPNFRDVTPVFPLVKPLWTPIKNLLRLVHGSCKNLFLFSKQGYFQKWLNLLFCNYCSIVIVGLMLLIY